MPQCGHVAAVLEATSLPAACLAFAQATAHAAGAIFTQAYLSLGALAFLFVMTFGFAKGGGAGAIPSGTLPPGSPDGFWLGLALRWDLPLAGPLTGNTGHGQGLILSRCVCVCVSAVQQVYHAEACPDRLDRSPDCASLCLRVPILLSLSLLASLSHLWSELLCKPDGPGLCRGRSGGLPTQLMFAAVHTGMHLLAALVLMVLLELGVETCIK